jgi:TnpA family transposase
MRATNKLLTVLSKAERAALYDLPDFDDAQRQEYLTFTEPEQQLIFSRPNIAAQIYCALQIGYFKAKESFFHFTHNEVKEDIAFIMRCYFSVKRIAKIDISKHEHYVQCLKIAELYGYQRWSKNHTRALNDYLATIIKRDVTTGFIVIELIAFLKKRKIIRPGYTTLQNIISNALSIERKRIISILKQNISEENKNTLFKLLTKDDILSGLAALKQDAKNFKTHMMIAEREKLLKLKPFYTIAKILLPSLELSQQNIQHYASLADYYNINELREKLSPELTELYLLCYAWQRYRQINDNLIEAICYHLNKFNKESKEAAKVGFSKYLAEQQDENILMKKLACFWVDRKISDDISFGKIRKKAFKIVPEEELRKKVLPDKGILKKIDFKWKSIDSMANRIKINLRPIIMILDFKSEDTDNKWMSAIRWLKDTFSKEQSLNSRLMSAFPEDTVPKKLNNFLLETNGHGQTKLRADRYEYWIYRQLRRCLNSSEIYLDDSIRHRSFEKELASSDQVKSMKNEINAPALKVPIKNQLDKLFSELDTEWSLFGTEFKEGNLTHLRYDHVSHTLHAQKIKTEEPDEDELQSVFYSQFPLTDITDVLRFVNKDCSNLKAFTPLQSRYSKRENTENILLAVIIAQAMNHGNLNMAQISNIPYYNLQDIYHAHCRIMTAKLSNDMISNAISKLSIFPFYSLDLALLYSAVDGQKFEVKNETTKARNSKKYFGKVKGVVAYTLLASQIPLQLELISPHDHESYYVFDIWYSNTTNIIPEVVTGDMHCINKGNFAIMHWFGAQLYPRFTNLQDQLKHLYCSPGTLKQYEDFLIKPIGEIDRQLIEEEWPNLSRIIVTLGLKEISQSILVKKLCNLSISNKTRKALFEYDKLIRSIYTLKYLRDPKLQKNVHRSQNRIESYQQLRGAIAQAYGKKQLSGKTDTAISISNECGRLIANAIIYYNSAILSKMKDKFEAEGNTKGLELLKKISPVAWQHINFMGHYLFSEDFYLDLDLIVSKLITEGGFV